MQQGPFTCICGREFQNIQAFRGHKSHCEEHLKSTGRLHIRQQVDKDNRQRISQGLKKRQAEIDAAKQQQWIAEQHHCERCGKLMLTKYGSGRFCSKFCSNSRPQSEEMKAKVREASKRAYEAGLYPYLGWGNVTNRPEIDAATLQERNQKRLQILREKYEANPRRCVICGAPIAFEHRHESVKTCSPECSHQYRSQRCSEAAARAGGNLNPYGVRGTAKYGTYQGYHCDSSWELAFVMYCLDHDLDIERNTEGFPYTYNGEEHLYFPDFIVNNIYIEIKNYNTDEVEAKRQQFPDDKMLEIIFKPDIKPYLDYATKTYGKDFAMMYDQDKPSWMDKQK